MRSGATPFLLEDVDDAEGAVAADVEVNRDGGSGFDRRPPGGSQHLLLVSRDIAHAGVVRRVARDAARSDLAQETCPDPRVAEADPHLVRETLRQLLDRRLANPVRVRRLDIRAGALDDVQAGGARHARDGGRVDSDAVDRAVDDPRASRSPEASQLVDRELLVAQHDVVEAAAERPAPQDAEDVHGDRGVEERALGLLGGSDEVAREIDEDVLVHRRRPELLRLDGAEHGHDLLAHRAGIASTLTSSRPEIPRRAGARR